MREVMDVQIERYSKLVTVAVVAGQDEVRTGEHSLPVWAYTFSARENQPALGKARKEQLKKERIHLKTKGL